MLDVKTFADISMFDLNESLLIVKTFIDIAMFDLNASEWFFSNSLNHNWKLRNTILKMTLTFVCIREQDFDVNDF